MKALEQKRTKETMKTRNGEAAIAKEVEVSQHARAELRCCDRDGRTPGSSLIHLWVEDQGPGIPAEEHEIPVEREAD